MEFDKFKSIETASGLKQEVIGREILPCDSVVLAVGQDNAFPWIERNIGLEFGKWDMPVVDKTTFMSTRPGVFFGGDAAFGPANIIWAVEQGHQAAISIHNYCQGIPVTERPAQGMTLSSTKMGLHEWAYSNDYDPHQRQKMQHVDLPVRFESMTTEVEKGFTAEQTRVEVERCLNCDMETHFVDSLCIECDACVDICPVDCLTITPDRRGAGAAAEVPRAGAQHRPAGVRVRAAQADQPGHGRRTRTSACTAASAPSDAPPTRGTCGSSCCRSRTQGRAASFRCSRFSESSYSCQLSAVELRCRATRLLTSELEAGIREQHWKLTADGRLQNREPES